MEVLPVILFVVSIAVFILFTYKQGMADACSSDSGCFDTAVFYAASAVEEGELINDHLDDLRKRAQIWIDKESNKHLMRSCFIETKMTGNILEVIIYKRQFKGE